MFDPRKLPTDERRHFYRRAAIAPLCLVLVAGLQVVRVVRCNQTPWKGGGFGMFSTVDAESARFLRCYLVTSAGELPLRVPEALEKREAELRAAPTAAAAEDLANRLARERWRWRDQRQRRESANLRATAGSSVTAVQLRRPQSNGQVDGLSVPPGAEHVLEPIPHNDPGLEAIRFKEVRVECWRYRFNPASAELRAEKLHAASSVARQEAVPQEAVPQEVGR